jgi:hypothetical protein
MKYLKFLWAVALNLAIVMVALTVLSNLEYQGGSQETAALAFIILGSIQMGFATLIRTTVTFTISNQKQNALILRALGKTEEANYLDEDSKKGTEALNETQYKFWINAIGATLVWLVAALTLLS